MVESLVHRLIRHRLIGFGTNLVAGKIVESRAIEHLAAKACPHRCGGRRGPSAQLGAERLHACREAHGARGGGGQNRISAG
jgi:hypothetical protein